MFDPATWWRRSRCVAVPVGGLLEFAKSGRFGSGFGGGDDDDRLVVGRSSRCFWRPLLSLSLSLGELTQRPAAPRESKLRGRATKRTARPHKLQRRISRHHPHRNLTYHLTMDDPHHTHSVNAPPTTDPYHDLNRPPNTDTSTWLMTILNPDPQTAIITTLCILLLPLIGHYLFFRQRSTKTIPTILLLGPSSSGKTALLASVRPPSHRSHPFTL